MPEQQPTSPGGGEWISIRRSMRKRWLKRGAIAILVIAIVGATLYWRRATLRQHSIEWSAQRHFRIADEELAAGNPKLALSRALTSIQLDPGRIATLRILFRAARQIRDYRLIVFASALHEHPDATPADLLATLETILEVEDFARFEVWFGNLAPEVQMLPQARLLHLRRLLGEGRGTEMLSELQADPELRETRVGRLLQLDAHWQRGRLYDDSTAAGLVLALLEEPGTEADRDAVLRRLSMAPPTRIPQRMAPSILAAIEHEPPEGLPPTLVSTLRVAAHPERREEIVRETVERLAVTSLDALCMWLALLGESRTLLEVTEDPATLQSPVVYEARAQALLSEGRDEEALALLRYSHPGVDSFEMALLEAKVARQLGRRSEAVSAWRKAQILAQNDHTRNRFVRLATVATVAGEEALAAEALVGGCRHPLGILPPAAEIAWVIGYLAEHDRPRELLDVTKRLLQREQEDPGLLNNAVYLSLLLEQKVGPAGLDAILLLRHEHPRLGALRNTLALAYLAEDRPEEALPLYAEAGSPAWEDLSSSARATYALVLAANGDVEGFRKVADTIHWGDLLNQEERFFQGRFAALRAAGEAPSPE